MEPLGKVGDSTIWGLHPIVSHKITERDSQKINGGAAVAIPIICMRVNQGMRWSNECWVKGLRAKVTGKARRWCWVSLTSRCWRWLCPASALPEVSVEVGPLGESLLAYWAVEPQSPRLDIFNWKEEEKPFNILSHTRLLLLHTYQFDSCLHSCLHSCWNLSE